MQSLILITVDCFRADHAGFLGYPRPTTPFLDSLAGESTVFENAIAAGAPTYFSVPAILASRYPLAHGRDTLGIAPDETTLASVLKDAGFATAAFSAANPYISTRFGYDKGFDKFEDFLKGSESPPPRQHRPAPLRSRMNRVLAKACHSNGFLSAAYDELYFQYCQKIGMRGKSSLDSERKFPSADVLVDRAVEWLKEQCGKRFFLWLHFMDPHGPYYPKAEALKMMGCQGLNAAQSVYLNSFWNRGDVTAARARSKRELIISLYDAGIRWVDEQVRRLAETLVEQNTWDRCVLAVTADHGEEFLEHGGRYHLPRNLTEELVHVPLLVRGPAERGKRTKPTFSLVDLAPTLLDTMGVPVPADFRGRSCWKQLQRGDLQERPAVSECVYGCSNPFYPRQRMGPRLLAVRSNRYKLVINFSRSTEHLYDLEQDPSEQRPLALDEARDVRQKLFERARKHVAESFQSRDFDRRIASQLREFRLELARPAAHFPAN